MTETEIAAMIELDIAGVEIARCHVITGHGPSPQPAQSAVNPMPLQNACGLSCDAPQPAWVVLANSIAELERQVADLTAERDHAVLRMEVAIATSHAWIDAEVRRRIAEAAAVACRDEQCRSAGRCMAAPLPCSAARFPASALRQQRQAIGLLSTADAGRVRLGGYAPSLPPR